MKNVFYGDWEFHLAVLYVTNEINKGKKSDRYFYELYVLYNMTGNFIYGDKSGIFKRGVDCGWLVIGLRRIISIGC